MTQNINIPGDNREVNIVTAVSVDVTFYVSTPESQTTAQDTATAKYFDNRLKPADKISIRPTQNCSIKAINGTNLTDPITVTSNGYVERNCLENYGGIASMTLTFTQDTNVKVRVV